MIVLDTDVVVELMRPAPESRVRDWVDARPGTDLYVTAITAAELMLAAGRLPPVRDQDALRAAVGALLDEEFADRVLTFDAVAAHHYGAVVAGRVGRGGIAMADAQTAAICRSTRAYLATRNAAPFEGTGVLVIDPWTAGGNWSPELPWVL